MIWHWIIGICLGYVLMQIGFGCGRRYETRRIFKTLDVIIRMAEEDAKHNDRVDGKEG
jgi:hypothetical protein